MRTLLTILFATTITVSAFGQADTSKYILTIKQGKYEKAGKQTYLTVPVTLTNNSADTLKYLSTTCSWGEFYCTDNKNMFSTITLSRYNAPIMLILAPYKSVDTEVKLVVKQTMHSSSLMFKIGLNLIKIKNENNLPDKYKEQQRETKNIIWSNAVTVTH